MLHCTQTKKGTKYRATQTAKTHQQKIHDEKKQTNTTTGSSTIEPLYPIIITKLPLSQKGN